MNGHRTKLEGNRMKREGIEMKKNKLANSTPQSRQQLSSLVVLGIVFPLSRVSICPPLQSRQQLSWPVVLGI